MFRLIMELMLLVLVVISTFLVTRRLVMLWTGRNKEEASKAIWSFFSQKEEYHLATDNMFVTDAWLIISDSIGEERYADLEKLSRTEQLYFHDYASGLPYVAFTIPYRDENEKCVTESMICKKVSEYLFIHGYKHDVLVDWKENYRLRMPCLMIRYAETNEQEKILNAVLSMQRQQITQKYQPVLDEDLDCYEEDESDIAGV